MEFLRFFAVAVFGLTFDLAIAWCAAHFLGLPLWIAATISFGLSSAANYMLLELWTFRSRANPGLSFSRALRYGLSQVVILMARIAAVTVLPMIFITLDVLVILILSSGFSFAMHFLISKYVVFSASRRLKGSPQ